MNVRHIANTRGGQDGAIWGNHLFRFQANGAGCVYDLSGLRDDVAAELPLVSEFTLDRAEEIVPHSNAVAFGSEYYAEGDEYPLLYSNIYNNYAKAEDPLCGVCCVYRLQREGTQFTTTLVQLIAIGFAQDKGTWRSDGEAADVRPYGNFAVDREKNQLYAFVMRDAERTTRYFAFDLPRLCAGEMDAKYGVRRVTLSLQDVKYSFDTPYSNFLQGACVHNGLIYSVEGFHDKIHPALRVIDPQKKREAFFFDFYETGYVHEAEFIDFYQDRCCYSDARGQVFELSFEQ